MNETLANLGRFAILAAATFLVVIGLHYAIGGTVHMGAQAAEKPKQAEPVKGASQPAPKAEGAPAAPVAAPTPPPTLTFRTSATIPMPRAIEVDGSVACRMDKDVLRCTARVAK